MRRVLVTGPVERIGTWCDAARAAGWEALELPLVEIVQHALAPEDLFEPTTRFDWLVVTSRSALPFVERALAALPTLAQRGAAVGEAATARLAELGLQTPIAASQDASELAARLVAVAGPGASVLWPRGDRADDLARKLRASALVVVDPVAYATRARRGLALPECEAVFFASPSAVQAWEELTGTTRAPRSAIAIGATTFDALVAGPGSRFEALTQLAEANPEALRHALAHMAG